MDVCKISFKNSILAIWNQLTRKGAWRNIFVTHNAYGANAGSLLVGRLKIYRCKILHECKVNVNRGKTDKNTENSLEELAK